MLRKSLIFVTLSWMTLACGGGEKSGVEGEEDNALSSDTSGQLNVIVILADALRADRLGAYGYTARPTSPSIDALAKDSAVFVNAVSQDAWTIPSVASLFSGVYPRTHRALKYQKGKTVEMDTLSMDHSTMAERFKDAGYATSALLKSPVIDSSKGYCQGFDTCKVVDGKGAWDNSGEDLTNAATGWLDAHGSGSPFFMYLHYMDPHSPYIPPEPWKSKYVGDYKGELTGLHKDYEPFQRGEKKASKADLEQLSAVYDASVEYWDFQIGRLVEHLKSTGRWENTIIVITADHGEALGERGHFFHGNLYQENIHVPLIFRVPGVKGQRLEQYAQMMDIAPTVTGLTGVSPSPAWHGMNQADAIRTGADSAQSVYTEYGHSKSLIDASGLKLILGEKISPLLFDLKADPGELKNLASSRPDDVKRLQGEIKRIFDMSMKEASNFSAAAPVTVDDATVDKMKAIGYVDD